MSVLYAQVIVDIVHENVAHTFTYRIPDGMTLTAGQRVEVPFGRMRKEGVVLSLTQETDVPPEKLRDVLRPLEDYAAICPTLLTLAQQMADDVHCPLAETLRLMLPAAMPTSSPASIRIFVLSLFFMLPELNVRTRAYVRVRARHIGALRRVRRTSCPNRE